MDDEGNDISDITDGRRGAGGRGPRPRGAVTGGWGFESGADGGSAAPGSRLSVDLPSPHGPKKSHFDDDDDIQPIPDLEEEAEEDITRQVAAPPQTGTALSQPVRSVRELDVALSSRASQLPASPEEGVDLAPLMQCLCSERQVFEADVTWEPELIFQEVASAINADLTASQEGGEEAELDNFNGPSQP
mmetsp:Transcript_16485/g.32222  ORF Transcript_16485/g.32222 Transcript_16485/m.32222 type:complete len:189 (-) Transcript_16485:93-659(-)|eukprot:CAMPEP_0172688148 /NCGR_PEP_ID=MMETSP1074-20121228/22221_1 /TAXON_ID=2916 /ORGANISM="Ceratium fusus, Strain PA161109" /LENGTH=188 /DNA_ID=CAMNT_0013507745 /DNA_START=37 /DNA_END=603 /DNA_ORIENTATION=-